MNDTESTEANDMITFHQAKEGGSMTDRDKMLNALKIIRRQQPCYHETTQSIGMGHYVKCEDCGATISAERIDGSRRNADTFADAITVLESATAAAMTNQGRMMCVVDIERLIHECVPGGDICDPQQVADAIREYAAAARTVGEYPPLPEWMECYSIPNDDFNNSSDSCLADRMRSYVDADRAMRAQAVPAAVRNH